MAELAHLKRQRAGIKSRVTIYQKQAEKLVQQAEFSQLVLSESESVLHRLRIMYTKFDDVQSQIEEKDEEEFNDDSRENFEVVYGEVETNLLVMINRCNNDLKGNTDQRNDFIKLPPITVPLFDGKFESWLAFRDVYVETVHENKNVAPATKFRYLLTSIKGGLAYPYIQGYASTAANYPLAWKAIVEAYDNDVRTKKLHMKNFYNIKRTIENSAESLSTFVITVKKHLNALKALDVDISGWDLFLVHHLSERLDTAARIEVEKESSVNELLEVDKFIEILNKRIRILEATSQSSQQQNNKSVTNYSSKNKQYKVVLTTSSNMKNCLICKQQSHSIVKCPTFLGLDPIGRYEKIKQLNACINCFGISHRARECQSGSCRICNLKHNTLLHRSSDAFQKSTKYNGVAMVNENSTLASDVVPIDNQISTVDHPQSKIVSSQPGATKTLLSGSASTTFVARNRNQIILGTALIWLQTENGNKTQARAVLDPGSQSNFITSRMLNLLDGKRRRLVVPVRGINGVATESKYETTLIVKSRLTDYVTTLDFLVLPQITDSLPTRSFHIDKNILSNIELADPTFNLSRRIDILIGAEIFPYIYQNETVEICKELPPLIKSVFGFVATGKMQSSIGIDTTSLCSTHISENSEVMAIKDLGIQLERFWQLENVQAKVLSIDEKICETHYQQHLHRGPEGRYTVAVTASEILQRDFYVDDLLSGADTVAEAGNLKTELQSLLAAGGFELRKWNSNVDSIRSNSEMKQSSVLVLGIRWDTENDKIQIELEVSKIFDPLGLCAPIVMTAKLYMQKIWSMHKIGWDDSLPSEFVNSWQEFHSQLVKFSCIEIPRCVKPSVGANNIQLHGFGDASKVAYGACIYLRFTDDNGNHVYLLNARSRVAPLNKCLTINRLELCSALLLAELMDETRKCLGIQIDAVYYWADSQTTLHRINSSPTLYKEFVSNRISRIQDLSKPSEWHYVPTALNPADALSRGLLPNQLIEMDLWWHGPGMLMENEDTWPKISKFDDNADDLECKPIVTRALTVHITEEEEFALFTRCSSYIRILRIMAYCLRFVHNCRQSKPDLKHGELSAKELNESKLVLIRIVQGLAYEADIKHLNKHGVVNHKSNLRSLYPFMNNGLLRVGGRLHHADIPFEQQHQILLPDKHRFTQLLVEYTHQDSLHAGVQTLLYKLRLQYWIPRGRNLCKKVVNKCIICFRHRPKVREQLMGSLPIDRVTPQRAFTVTGIDFCGPFSVSQMGRAKVRLKMYICIFICFCTKAVHMEVVHDLTTQGFIAALLRFTARRGKCKRIYSDNVTNFIGAQNELRELQRLFNTELQSIELNAFLAKEAIEWQTIPPRSPHFGGLWEEAVRRAKHHLYRMTKDLSIKIDELYTLVVQVEGILNTRPLWPMSEDPTDLNVLTPGHFLVGGPLEFVPDPSLLHLNVNRLTAYQRLQYTLQRFWKRWSSEYLSELQHRTKWTSSNMDYQVGCLVLVKEDNVPPGKWILARIVKVHPGTDAIVRVVTIKTNNGLFKRAVTRLCPLPIDY